MMRKTSKFSVLLWLIVAMAVSSQCLAQEKKNNKKENKEIKTEKDWNKFLDAHEKAHMVQNKKNKKEMRAQKILRAAIIGGVAYYVGYKVGQDEMKKGKKFKMAKKRPTEDWSKK
jgi:tRNA G10  N-methylase Trm11